MATAKGAAAHPAHITCGRPDVTNLTEAIGWTPAGKLAQNTIGHRQQSLR